MRRIFFALSFILISIIFYSCNGNSGEASSTQSGAVKDTCDDPDADINCCFSNMPPTTNNIMNIPYREGEPITITGHIYKEDAKTPLKDIIMYAYHTDSKGYYTKNGDETGVQKWHGQLHGWCKTADDGSYEIHSIRPARYPGNKFPAHIHSALKKPGNSEPFYISDFVFKDDSLVNEKYLESVKGMIGGTGIVELKLSKKGTWIGQRDIILAN